MLTLDELTGMFLGGMLGTGGVPYWARRARIFGEPEIEEPSLSRGVPGRMFTGLVGVDIVYGGDDNGEDARTQESGRADKLVKLKDPKGHVTTMNRKLTGPGPKRVTQGKRQLQDPLSLKLQ